MKKYGTYNYGMYIDWGKHSTYQKVLKKKMLSVMNLKNLSLVDRLNHTMNVIPQNMYICSGPKGYLYNIIGSIPPGTYRSTVDILKAIKWNKN